METNDKYVEYYRWLRELFALQGNRLWQRFHFFLTVEVAITSFYFLGKLDFSLKATSSIAGSWSLIWTLISYLDYSFYNYCCQNLREFEKREILETLNTEKNLYQTTLYKITKPWDRRNVTFFSVIIPFVFCLVWGICSIIVFF